MLPVFVRFHVNHHAQPPIHATLDTNKVILIGREDLQKTRAEGTLFWMRVAGGMVLSWREKYPRDICRFFFFCGSVYAHVIGCMMCVSV
jgi:hypothetical protein